MRFFRAVLLALLAALGCAPTARPAAALHINEMIDTSVALVDGDRITCGGVWIDEVDILTARHCVADAKIGEIVRFAQWSDHDAARLYPIIETHGARLVRIGDGPVDLALLRTSMPAAHPHGWANVAHSVESGSMVSIVGHPDRLAFTFTLGTVSASRYMLTPAGGAAKLLQVSAPVYFGSSGGPAFVNGELVGICSFMGATSNIALFVHRDDIQKFMIGVPDFGAPTTVDPLDE